MSGREIKFRAKDLKTGEWVTGYYATLHCPSIFNDEEDRQAPFWHSVDPDTLGQSTGLHDMCGDEIFEGDIIEDPEYNNGTLMRVFWLPYFAGFRCYHPFYGVFPIHQSQVEVVGNIYDNADMLYNLYGKEDAETMLDVNKILREE